MNQSEFYFQELQRISGTIKERYMELNGAQSKLMKEITQKNRRLTNEGGEMAGAEIRLELDSIRKTEENLKEVQTELSLTQALHKMFRGEFDELEEYHTARKYAQANSKK